MTPQPYRSNYANQPTADIPIDSWPEDVRDKAYLFTTHSKEPIGMVDRVVWDFPQNRRTPNVPSRGEIFMHPNTVRAHRSIHVAQVMGLALPNNIWYVVSIIGLTSRGGHHNVQSSTCAGKIRFNIHSDSIGKPKGRFKKATFPLDTVPHFDTPEEAEKWLDLQSGVR